MKKKDLIHENEFLKECLLDLSSEYIDDCNKFSKKINNLHISLNKQYDKVKRQAEEITLLLQQKKQINFQYLGVKAIYEQNKRLLDIQDKAIIKKDEQFKALKELYRHDLINGRI